MRFLFLLLFLTAGACAQPPAVPTELKLLGTRRWIRVGWIDKVGDELGYKIYCATLNKKPGLPLAVVGPDVRRFFIQQLKEQTKYYIWVESFNASGVSKPVTGTVITSRNWSLDPDELKLLSPASSAAVPEGMALFWNDEFNDELLNRNKWSTNYYSNIDFLKKDNLLLMRQDSLPQPAMSFNGHSIHLFTNDSLPVKSFYPASGRKISSIQTYDWRTNENFLDNSRGGYFEVRVKRSSSGKPQGVNTAFWMDSPGPDLKYYLQQGTTLEGVSGIRPAGQVFEIDVFEMLNAQFVLHGSVDQNGNFVHNLATHIAESYNHIDQWVTHGILWTPTSIKHYINGNLIKEYSDKHKIYSPNHFMNVFLGSYGAGGSVDMEVDYIRGYQWPLLKGNELPNPGFDANKNLLPWEGTGKLSSNVKRNGDYALVLNPGQYIEQYVYLNHSMPYQLEFWMKGKGNLKVTAKNLTPVSGDLDKGSSLETSGNDDFSIKRLEFKTGSEFLNHMKTVRIKFVNTGTSAVILDDVKISKVR
ncbi:family 16 glycosylhydrolase [Pedobacter sp. N36a]|uniref:family 16 glycosylhydrolase n=1 Tax=Pedobacter sp. N36a TaxID=2767996 RepID=UPI00165710BA|nr:family 16 glycosylhydrolase [Pedobacter sp. N36a]MBC8988025.1 family 16 glycosylhydrolase [Pedobacter sp. N36a]